MTSKETVIAFVQTPEGSAQIIQDGEDSFAIATDNKKDTLTRIQLVNLAMSVVEALATEDEMAMMAGLIGYD